MPDTLIGWSMKGFARSPVLKTSPASGLTVYRCWGGTSTEMGGPGGGYYSLERPSSVVDAELRFNIADWGNQIQFLSIFQILPGVKYWEGPVFHRAADLRRSGTQVFVEPPLQGKVRLTASRQPLKRDAFVSPRPGNA